MTIKSSGPPLKKLHCWLRAASRMGCVILMWLVPASVRANDGNSASLVEPLVVVNDGQANTANLLADNPTRGQVLGITTADGRYPSSRPVAVHEILSTMYHQLGVDPTGLLRDAQGRPTAIPPEAKPIAELLA